MKKQAMSLAVTAALLGGAVSATGQSMYINEGGLGEVLVYPFYSSSGGNDTYVQVVNTTNFTKAVKVRFIEAQNSDEVLDFNLYLSPQDEWAAVVTTNPLLGGPAIVRTVDNSCTVPELGTQGGTKKTLANGDIVRDQPFSTALFTGDTDTSNERTTEGYIEIIEMGQLDPTFGFGADAVHLGALVVAPGVPFTPVNCPALVTAWNPAPAGAWVTNPSDELLNPWQGGGLYGYSVLINVDEGTAVGVDAVAVDEFAAVGPAGTVDPGLHTNPGNLLPQLTSGTNEAVLFDNGIATLFTFTAAGANGGRDAFSSLFMTDGIVNDYVIDPDIDALTDWVITMPTKSEYDGTSPFTAAWNNTNACEPVTLELWDREEAPETPITEGPVFSPAPPAPPGPPGFNICTEVSVVTFGPGSAIEASSKIRYGLPNVEFTEGWASLQLFQGVANEIVSDNGTLTGLPATGFAVFEYTNNFLDGGTVKANYEAAVEHKELEIIFP
jgi:hypothetical protein